MKSSNRAELSMASAGTASSKLSLTAAAMLAVTAAAPDVSGKCNRDADKSPRATPAIASSGERDLRLVGACPTCYAISM